MIQNNNRHDAFCACKSHKKHDRASTSYNDHSNNYHSAITELSDDYFLNNSEIIRK